MSGWLVNDALTCIGGTRTLWHHLLEGVLTLENRCTGSFSGLAEAVEAEAHCDRPDYILRNAAYFRPIAVDCPQIAFVQDVLNGPFRSMLVDVCSAADRIVFNSAFTQTMYPELSAARSMVIPIGTDFDLFYPRPTDADIPANAILYVGSGASVKGWDRVVRLAAESSRPVVYVMKDETPTPSEPTTFRRIPQRLLARIASSCAVGICMSRTETQHLAGIEMGACGLPMAVTNVGAYWGRAPGAWGEVVTGDWHEAIERLAAHDRASVRTYWRAAGFDLVRCVSAWERVIAEVSCAVR